MSLPRAPSVAVNVVLADGRLMLIGHLGGDRQWRARDDPFRQTSKLSVRANVMHESLLPTWDKRSVANVTLSVSWIVKFVTVSSKNIEILQKNTLSVVVAPRMRSVRSTVGGIPRGGALTERGRCGDR